MSAPQAIADGHVPSRRARAREVVRFEWTKLRSARSNYWTLLIAAAATLAVTAVAAHALASSPTPPPGPIDPLTGSFLGYAEYAVLPVAILGALTFTSEYASGLIRTTFTAVPRRWAVLAAKTAVAGTTAFAAGALLALACFALTQAILAAHHRGLSVSHPGVARAVFAVALFLAACALVGLGLGALLRHTAAAIAATVVLIYLLAAFCLLLPSPWNLRIGKFTLPFAAYQVVTLHPQAGLLSPGACAAILISWPAAVLVAAAIALSRRDA